MAADSSSATKLLRRPSPASRMLSRRTTPIGSISMTPPAFTTATARGSSDICSLAPLLELSTRNRDKRPLAYDFYEFFHGLPTAELARTNGWLQITRLEDVARGDNVAWRLHGSNEPGDTGHVFVVVEAPTPLTGEHDSDVHFAVQVYDSSSKEHFNDSRSDEGRFKGGVGSGTLHIETGANGVPSRYRVGEARQYQTAPTAIGQIEPFLSA